jgi:hypothetical protein
MDSEPVSAICTPAFSGRSPWEDHRNSRAGHRAACPAQHHGGTVRHTSVNPATQGPAAPRDDIPRDRKETARIAAEMQRAGRLSMWWQVLGSNQRRFSRRFFSPSLLPQVHAADQRMPGVSAGLLTGVVFLVAGSAALLAGPAGLYSGSGCCPVSPGCSWMWPSVRVMLSHGMSRAWRCRRCTILRISQGPCWLPRS